MTGIVRNGRKFTVNEKNRALAGQTQSTRDLMMSAFEYEETKAHQAENEDPVYLNLVAQRKVCDIGLQRVVATWQRWQHDKRERPNDDELKDMKAALREMSKACLSDDRALAFGDTQTIGVRSRLAAVPSVAPRSTSARRFCSLGKWTRNSNSRCCNFKQRSCCTPRTSPLPSQCLIRCWNLR